MPTIEQKFMTVPEFLEALGGRLSKNTVYSAINRGEIPCVFVGRRRLIPEDALTQMLQTQNAQGDPVAGRTFQAGQAQATGSRSAGNA